MMEAAPREAAIVVTFPAEGSDPSVALALAPESDYALVNGSGLFRMARSDAIPPGAIGLSHRQRLFCGLSYSSTCTIAPFPTLPPMLTFLSIRVEYHVDGSLDGPDFAERFRAEHLGYLFVRGQTCSFIFRENLFSVTVSAADTCGDDEDAPGCAFGALGADTKISVYRA